MTAERGLTPHKDRVVLVAGADDVCLILSTELKDRIRITQAADFSSASKAFGDDRPQLLICGLDGDGWQFGPLIRTAGRFGVPVLAVAGTEEAVAAAGVVSWAIDRRKGGAVVSLALRLLDEPTYVPDNPSNYPPPPKAMDEKIVDTGVKILQAQMVEKSKNNKKIAEKEADAESVLKRLEAQIKATLFRAWDESTEHFASQAKYLHALQLRVAAQEEQSRSMHADFGEMINAVSIEGVTLHAELKEMVDALSARSKAMTSNLGDMIRSVSDENTTAIIELRATLNGIMSQLRPSSPDLDKHVERLSSTIMQRSSEIDALQTAITDVEIRGLERETDLQDQINAVQNRFAYLDKEIKNGQLPSPATATIPIDLVETLEQRFTEIEGALSKIENAKPNVSGGTDFTRQFEDIWETQTLLTQLQRKVDALEQRSSGAVVPGTGVSSVAESAGVAGPSEVRELKQAQAMLDQRLAGLDQRYAAVEAAVLEVKRQGAELAKAPLVQFSRWEQRLAGIEGKINRLDETVASITPSSAIERQLDQVRDTVASILQRVNSVERSSSSPPPPETNAQKMASIQKWQSNEKRFTIIESTLARLDKVLPVANSDQELRKQIAEMQKVQSLMFQSLCDMGKQQSENGESADAEALEGGMRTSYTGTIKSWPQNPPQSENVRQRKIIRTNSSQPPKPGNGDRASGKPSAPPPKSEDAREESSDTLTELYLSLEKFHEHQQQKNKR